MSSNDGTTPPVLFVVGTAGAGKSSLVTSFQRWARFLDIDVLAINLDPGAERVHYDPEFDVRDLISLSEVMDDSKFQILVLGGSQGSQQINDILSSALENKIVPSKWSFVHQTGRLDCKKLIEVYEKTGVEFEMKEYIKDMSKEYRNCDIVISRSGAMTVSEICSSAKPSILLPLPWSADNHQYYNASYLEEKGAAVIIESNVSNSDKLFELLIELEKNHNKRNSMMKAASMVFPESTSKNIYKIINESLKIQA